MIKMEIIIAFSVPMIIGRGPINIEIANSFFDLNLNKNISVPIIIKKIPSRINRKPISIFYLEKKHFYGLHIFECIRNFCNRRRKNN